MLTSPQKSVKLLKPSEKKLLEEQLMEERMEEQRIHDVLLLLEDLARREETTVKLILDCLYDVGSKNLINKKFRVRPLNKMMKSIATTSKPVFRFLAFRWFKKNCPEIIANWLHSKVSF
ncbi:MAG: hypothetical protein F6K10_43670 [Moorea sp. SIO2B7]|nr:hypothetical protein [Moorena sp. SIO2B7]